ncbi:MAG: insulinase family protein [Halobacteriovoraceae bacterium]|nr:insulinase family protein [Halobacteriovoraceae bacterium]MCB9095583.1 insulinase family protein [Halobacteriovoraceae bacterium]
MKILFYLLCVFSINAFSALDYGIVNYDWDGLDVVWVEDNKFPTYDIIVYFGEGALGDEKKREGQTSFMFDLMSHGTDKYSQAQLADKLDFFGTSFGSEVTHEYSILSYSGLSKDVLPVTELLCHTMRNATYPQKELDSYRSKVKGSLKNLVANHGSLANRIFRRVTLDGTPFSTETAGNLSSIDNITRESLLGMKDYFNNRVYKKVFITGPSDVLKVKDLFIKNCRWGGKDLYRRNKIANVKADLSKKTYEKIPLYFASVKGANQAQIRVGNALPTDFFKGDSYNLSQLTSTLLGGSFTSLLMQELRVKRGLTYGAYSAAAPQALYGRSVLSTSTRNDSVLEALYTIRDTLQSLTEGKVDSEKIEGTKQYLKGNHLLQFESNYSFLANLVTLDHLGIDYSEIKKFPAKIDSYSREQVIQLAKNIFNWSSQLVFVLGDNSVKEKLLKSNIFDVREINVTNYL